MSGKYLSKEQREVIEALFAGEMEESEILRKFGISRRSYRKWFKNEEFAEEIEFRMQCAKRHGELAALRYAALASSTLVGLAQSDKPETARKACVDLIAINSKLAEEKGKKKKRDSVSKLDIVSYQGCSPEAYEKALSVLANDKRRQATLRKSQ